MPVNKEPHDAADVVVSMRDRRDAGKMRDWVRLGVYGPLPGLTQQRENIRISPDFSSLDQSVLNLSRNFKNLLSVTFCTYITRTPNIRLYMGDVLDVLRSLPAASLLLYPDP